MPPLARLHNAEKKQSGPFENREAINNDVASINDPRFQVPGNFLKEAKNVEREGIAKRKVRGAFGGSMMPGPEREWFTCQAGPFENLAGLVMAGGDGEGEEWTFSLG